MSDMSLESDSGEVEVKLPELKEYTRSLNESLDNVETTLQPLLEAPLNEISAKLDVIQRAKLQAMNAQIIVSLLAIYLRTRGKDPKTHDLQELIVRIKDYGQKIEDTVNPPKQTLKLDRAAAGRLIKHSTKNPEREIRRDEERMSEREYFRNGTEADRRNSLSRQPQSPRNEKYSRNERYRSRSKSPSKFVRRDYKDREDDRRSQRSRYDSIEDYPRVNDTSHILKIFRRRVGFAQLLRPRKIDNQSVHNPKFIHPPYFLKERHWVKHYSEIPDYLANNRSLTSLILLKAILLLPVNAKISAQPPVMENPRDVSPSISQSSTSVTVSSTNTSSAASSILPNAPFPQPAPRPTTNSPNLPSAIDLPGGINPHFSYEYFSELVQKRITTFTYLKRAHEGRIHWFNTVCLTKDDLATEYDNSRMKRRTGNFFILGASLALILDITNPHDYVRALTVMLQEFEYHTNEHSKQKMSKGTKDEDTSFQESGEYTYLYVPNIPFELDYFQTFYTLCDILVEIYHKLLVGTANMWAGQFAENVLKADGKFKKIISLVTKEIDSLARNAVKEELSSVDSIISKQDHDAAKKSTI
ncbi:hypothetical protein G9A89_020503 [Geosiphon pyriformis]|nr:hypothetical protein G9A89_020503 [Geosiphon pyriformis]